MSNMENYAAVSAANVRTALPPISLASPVPRLLYHSHRSPLVITAMLV